jgi:hypothetical protein
VTEIERQHAADQKGEIRMKLSLIASLLIFLSCVSLHAQTTAFTYQGSLTDGSNPANGNFQMQFKLFDAVSGGTQIGSTVSDVAVTAANGVFKARLDFGASAFTGSNRWLEIAVRHNSGEAYVTLSPREQIASSPYSVRTLSAAAADSLAASCVGCVTSSQIASVNGSAVTGTIPLASVPTGSTNYIQNSNSPQAASNFNISGNGIIGGRVGIGTGIPTTKLEVVDPVRQLRFGPTAADNGGYLISTAPHQAIISGGGKWEVPNWIARDAVASMTAHQFGGIEFYTNEGLTVGSSYSPNQRMKITAGGDVGIGTTTPGYRLDVIGGVRSRLNESTHFVAETTGGTNSWAALFLRTPSQGWMLGTSRDFNNNEFYIYDETTGRRPFSIQTSGIVAVRVLQITGGSDLAESFEISPTDSPAPGMVVAIDPVHPAKLILARGEYNRRVAGVISGANGLAAGMLLPDLQGADRSMPVALSGRVWVYADATRHAIRVGDLLTTSGLPGHTMRARDLKKANGAVLGKAMTRLESGTGLVLMLVTLQ